MPAIFYMNQSSNHICNLVRDLNAAQEDNIAAYSIDAGFHVQVFTMKENAQKVKQAIQASKVIKLDQLIETSIDPNGVEWHNCDQTLCYLIKN